MACVAVQLLKLTLVVNWTEILIKINALVGTLSQAFETLGENNSYKDYEIGWD